MTLICVISIWRSRRHPKKNTRFGEPAKAAREQVSGDACSFFCVEVFVSDAVAVTGVRADVVSLWHHNALVLVWHMVVPGFANTFDFIT